MSLIRNYIGINIPSENVQDISSFRRLFLSVSFIIGLIVSGYIQGITYCLFSTSKKHSSNLEDSPQYAKRLIIKNKTMMLFYNLVSALVFTSLIFIFLVFCSLVLIIFDFYPTAHAFGMIYWACLISFLYLFLVRFGKVWQSGNLSIKSTYCPLFLCDMMLMHTIVDCNHRMKLYLPCDFWQQSIIVCESIDKNYGLVLQDECYNYLLSIASITELNSFKQFKLQKFNDEMDKCKIKKTTNPFVFQLRT